MVRVDFINLKVQTHDSDVPSKLNLFG
jgi:hypothetical protein